MVRAHYKFKMCVCSKRLHCDSAGAGILRELGFAAGCSLVGAGHGGGAGDFNQSSQEALVQPMLRMARRRG